METLSDAIPRHADSGVDAESDDGFPGFDPSVIAEFLAGLDPSGVDEDRLLTGMAGMERIVAAAHAAQVKMMAEFTRLRPATSEEPFGEFVADEIATELCMTRNAAANRVAQAVVMTTRTPAVLQALEAGVLDLYRARIITEAVYGVDEATAAQIAGHVVDRAEGRNAPQIRALVRRAVLRVDPDGAQRRHERARAGHRHERARAGHRVVLDPREEGMAELVAFLPADQATAVYQRVDALAGADDKPGTLDGYGPIGAAYARKIAADPTGVWKRLVTDPIDGSLIEHTRNTYRPPAALDHFVRARDGKCRFPGCQHSARHADLDHTIPWPKGPTTPGNLGALCRRRVVSTTV